MDAAAWLAEHATLRTDHASFACLDGCGFCCTYPPEVTSAEMDELSQAAGHRSFDVDPSGTTHLPLQGGCGGCALLEDRRCTAYEARPMHCRLFPFHVYIGRQVEIYTNRVCPGLDPDPDAVGVAAEEAEPAAIEDAVEGAMGAGRLARLRARQAEAEEVHAEFFELTREHGVHDEPDPAIERAREAARITRQAWEDALSPFRMEDPAALPTMVLPREGFPWRAWRLEGYRFLRYELAEDGTLDRVGQLPAPSMREPVPEACWRVLDRLIGYECFAGGVFDRVDHSGYEVRIADAALGEANEVLAELAVRAHLLQAEGIEPSPRWLAAAYEPAFYDRGTIGAWL